MKKGFTLIEILIVVAILSIVSAILAVSFGNIRSKSEDSRRKTDLEEVRSALEQYKSNNNSYPTPEITITMGLPFGSSGLTDTRNTYMNKIPQDPDFPVKSYYYESTDGSDYILRSELNNPEPTPCNLTPTPDLCGSTHACNYCYSSYGQR
jgi:general secretion pathway protein G